MSTPLPANVSVCGVKGRFAFARLVAGDSDGVMDLVPVAGLVVTLTPAPPFVLAPSASTPTVIVPESLTLTTDSNGILRDVTGSATAYVIASDDPDINPHDWTYTVAFSGTSASKFTSYSAVFPSGSTVDLSSITPAPSSLGQSASAAQAAAAAAAASAVAAAASATAAANPASVITPALRVTGGSPAAGKVLTSDSIGNATWQTSTGGSGGSVGTGYPQTVLVVSGTEARPGGSAVVLWIDTRAEATRPDNMDNAYDLWFTPNGAPSGDTVAPGAPTGLASSSITASGFTVSWNASTDNVAVTSYQVRTGTDTPISVSGTTYSFTGLSGGTNYSVTARARDAAGNWSAWSSALSVTTSGDTTAPSVPTGLASSSITSSGFTVSWTASTDNVAVTGYEVFLGGVSYGTTSATSLAVTGRAASTAYSVTVRARDAAANWSAQSSALSVTTSASGGAPAPISRFNFSEGSGTTATSTADGYTMVDMTGGSPVWGSGTIKSYVRGYVIGSTGSTLTQWSVAIDFTLNAAPSSEGTFWLKDGSTQTYFNLTTGRAVRVYGVATTTSTDLVSLSTPHRLVVTQDATTLKVYLDGTEIISATEQRDFTRSLNSLNYSPLNIDYDTFRVWDSALTSGQVSALGA